MQRIIPSCHGGLRQLRTLEGKETSPIFKCLSAYQDSQDDILQDDFLALYASFCPSYRVEASNFTFQQQNGRYCAGRLSCSQRVTPTWFVRDREITAVQYFS